jgi:hypothetical protein
MHPIGKEELMALIRSRTADIKQRTMDRVRVESYSYVALIVIPLILLFSSRGLTLRAILAGLGVFAALGTIIGALAYKEFRLRTLPLGGSLKESLAALVAAIHSTARFYLATYMICVIVGVASVERFVFWRYGVSLISAAALVCGVAFVFWAYRSGQAYVRRMFGGERADLMNCLDELERM